MLSVYQGLDITEQNTFVQKFADTKGSKNFGWMKDFSDTLENKKTTIENYTEKYMTRSTF